MKRLLLMFTTTAALIVLIWAARMYKHAPTPHGCAIALIQTASHPALDQVRAGFIETMKTIHGPQCSVEIYNAQGSAIQAHTIAQQLHSRAHRYHAFFAIGTPAAQAISAVEQSKPIIFAAVTDPEQLGLRHLGTNVTGVTDMVDVNALIDLAQAIVPHARTIGILYSPGELNSLALITLFQTELQRRNLKLSRHAMSTEAEAASVTRAACRASPVLITTTDHTVAATITTIAAVAQEERVPLIVSDQMLVHSGALAGKGVDYHASGTMAAEMTRAIIFEAKKPESISVLPGPVAATVLNETVAAQLAIVLPPQLREHAILVTH